MVECSRGSPVTAATEPTILQTSASSRQFLQPKRPHRLVWLKKKYKPQANTNYLDTNTGDDSDAGESFYLLKVGSKASQPIIVNLGIEGKIIPMEVDMGAAFSIISEETYWTALPDLPPNSKVIPTNTYRSWGS